MEKKRARRWSIADARAVLTEQAASGLSMGAFAARERIDPWRLYRWRQRLDAEKHVTAVDVPKRVKKAKKKKKKTVSAKPRANAEPTTPAIIELRAAQTTSSNIEIVLPSGVVVRVSETIDTAAVARLISVLRS